MQKESNVNCSLFFVSNCLIYQYLALIIPDLMLICCTSDFLAFLLPLQGWDKVVVSNMCPRLSTIVHDCPKNDRKMRFRIGHSYFGKGVTNHQKSIVQWDLKKRVNVVGRPLSPSVILLSTVASHATERCKEL